MNKIITIIFISFVLLSACTNSNDKKTESLQSKTVQLNQNTLSLLQIDLNSLKWLLGASPDSYLHYKSLEQDGQLPSIRSLEEKGYVTLQIVDQLPDGLKDKFLRIIPTPRGNEIIRTIQNNITRPSRTDRE